MTNLARSDTEWKEGLFRKLGIGLRLGRTLLELRDRFREERIQVLNVMDKNANVHADDGSITLAGVKYGTNTSEDGKLFMRVTGGPTYTVSLYKATGGGGGDKVAEGTAAASGTATLAEQSSSGLTGTLRLAGSVTGEADDVHYLRPYLDWRKDAKSIFDGSNDTITGDDSRSLFAFYDLANDLGASADAMLSRLDTWFSEFLVSAADNTRSYGAEWLDSAEGTLISEASSDGGSGDITRIRGGVLQDLLLSMQDEATGATQYVVRRLLAGGAATADTGNTGAGAIASHVPEAHCPIGTFYFTCAAGLGTGDGGEEQFRVTFSSSENDDSFAMSELLTIKQSYKGVLGFGPVTLTRTLSKTGDGSNANLSVVTSGWSTTAESEDNTSAGTLYWRVIANGSNWDFSFYKAAAMSDSADLVAKAENIATAAVFTATAKLGSGLTVTGQAGSGPVTTTSGTLVLGFFTVQNASNKPDRLSLAVTQTSTGKGQWLFHKLLDFKANGTAAGAETIDDGMLANANTWEAFATEDN